MLIEPEALLMFAERAGLKLWRDGKILLIEYKGGLPEEWKTVISQNKAALLPIIPEVPAGMVGKKTKSLDVPERENLDMFGHATEDMPNLNDTRPPGACPMPTGKANPKRRKQPVNT